MGAQTCIAVKRISSTLGVNPLQMYQFFLSYEKPHLRKAEGAIFVSTVSVNNVPKIYGKLLENSGRFSGEKYVGEIWWKIEGNTATSFFYMPKTNAKEIGGLGYYLDLLSCNDLLKSYQVRYVRSPNEPDSSFIKQMERVGNRPGEPTEIRTYMENNAKAVRFKAKKFLQGLFQE
ncbi:MAG: hypothetical protein NTV88_04130 [Candidatus Micrarchaeota archaeon]|nr:hypothetical protein [Candidatus Micrarchaeota archaeon]